MWIITVLMFTSAFREPNPEVDGEQLMRLLEGLHSQVHDYELVCEGRIRFADTAEESIKEGGPKIHEMDFQGSFGYRSADGADYLDLYQKPIHSDGSFLHGTYAQIKGEFAKTVRSSDQKDLPQVIEKGPGVPGSLNFPCSPERIIYLHRWRRWGYRAGNIGYGFEGWDELNGMPTLRIRVNEFPRSHLLEEKWSRFWIDLKRGGHVIKHESFRGSHLESRTYNIVLEQFQLADGTKIWFPVHGELDSFAWQMVYRPDPVLHEVYDVVRGSLIFNRGLADERFSIGWKGHGPKVGGLKRLAEEYRSRPPRPRPPGFRTDPVGVEEDQMHRLAEADRQAEELDASPPSRPGWNATVFLQSGLTIVGIVALLAAFFLRRRAL